MWSFVPPILYAPFRTERTHKYYAIHVYVDVDVGGGRLLLIYSTLINCVAPARKSAIIVNQMQFALTAILRN